MFKLYSERNANPNELPDVYEYFIINFNFIQSKIKTWFMDE